MNPEICIKCLKEKNCSFNNGNIDCNISFSLLTFRKKEKIKDYSIIMFNILCSKYTDTGDKDIDITNLDELKKIELIDKDCPYYTEHQIYDWNNNESGNL